MGPRLKDKRGISDLENKKLKAVANEQPTITPIIMSTLSQNIK